LFDFTDQELYDILAKPDEWSAFDYQLSQRILKERGKEIDKDFLNSLRKTRIEDLAKPEEKQTNNVWVGYLFSLLGGLIGIAIGWNMMSSKKKLPNGEEIFSYQENDRKHGKRIMILGIVMLIILTFLRIINRA
jgi:ATP-dependent Zn protease